MWIELEKMFNILVDWVLLLMKGGWNKKVIIVLMS